ncbi:MAG: sigma-54-dependent Fis family transcriptional regulator [Calothrix sp. SM1_5_4]|nr:sigma-54-dependent Fis family transcriptional regulator [Calothrix sp. SM1_5_4]
MRKIYEVAESVATSRASVLITGESGTGKELLARFIHAKSPRSLKRFVALNCAAVPEGLLESELFGFERGAFTGADQRKIGKFEQANESTFLLDEISEMPLLLQAKLLRVLQEGEVERLGGQGPVKVNVRIVATTNRALEQMVKSGEFREDLYYRLNVIPLQVPPLRARPLDIEILSRHFVEMSCADNGVPLKRLADDALLKLKSYGWPGNVRELQNVIERSILLCHGQEIFGGASSAPGGSTSRGESFSFHRGLSPRDDGERGRTPFDHEDAGVHGPQSYSRGGTSGDQHPDLAQQAERIQRGSA